jgi:hypothetical protein
MREAISPTLGIYVGLQSVFTDGTQGAPDATDDRRELTPVEATRVNDQSLYREARTL